MNFHNIVRAISLQNSKYSMRVPSIKFRKGGLASGGHSSGTAASTQHVKGGQNQTQIVLQELPARFQRRPISVEEMEYINRGGPA